LREILVFFWEICLIAFLQIIIEVFINSKERPYLARVLEIGSYLVGLYLLMRFLSAYIAPALRDLASALDFTL
jgi:galactitol-specific phosphotransferase system IIC component